MERREAYIAMNLLPEIGPARLRLLLDYFPDPRNALGAPLEQLEAIPRLGSRCANVLHNWQQHCPLAQEIRRIEQAGIYLLTWEDDLYPALLKEIHDPPICLYLRGDLQTLQDGSRTLAMVGSRFTTAYGESVARMLAESAARQGWIIVSGLARGIDTVCHQTVVAAGGRTIAVLGSGLDRVYPPENLDLCRAIVQHHGVVLTEFPLGSAPDRQNFPQRNRIISGLSRGTLVIEAGLRSGSLITASQASEQGRTVFAVPGRVDNPCMQGCHALLKEGARLVESFQDILEEFSILPTLDDARRARESEERETARRTTPVPLPPLEYSIWNRIGDGEIGIDELVAELQTPVGSVLSGLLSLEIRQLIIQLPGKRVRRIPDHPAVPQSTPQ